MAKKMVIKQNFPIECYGRDEKGNEVLEEPVEIELEICQGAGTIKGISGDVKCEYNTGGHHQRCKASHPDVDKVGDGVTCPFSFDLPYASDTRAELIRLLKEYRKEMKTVMDSNQQDVDGGKYDPEDSVYQGKSARAAILSHYIKKLDKIFSEFGL